MTKPAIKVEGLYKEYVVGHAHERHDTFYELLSQTIKSPLKRLRSLAGEAEEKERFWALQDVNFGVQPGEVVGIIGRNGAGKSTLLKILSRITAPSKGRIEVRGRLASLLEVGTGFHPELSGRENIYLNAAILGMTRKEVTRKFDEIISFAEIEKFVDTPVKRYSSGMYVRLAFAVAAHLEPEILLVDEVLAVGDAVFQKKCLGKLGEISGQGRTVLFVSHSMNAIEALCSRVVLLNGGTVKEDSPDVRRVIDGYLSNVAQGMGADAWEKSDSRFENAWFDPLRFALEDGQGNALQTSVRNDGEAWVVIEGMVQSKDPALSVGYALHSSDGRMLYWSLFTDSEEHAWPNLELGLCRLKSRIPPRLLNEGEYKLELMLGLHYREWLVEPGKNAPSISLSIRGGLSDSPYWISRRPGELAPVLEWSSSLARKDT
jgi:lipopolysaccharide transport system ATP-binding protein